MSDRKCTVRALSTAQFVHNGLRIGQIARATSEVVGKVNPMHRGASCGSMDADSNAAVLDGLQSLWFASTDIKSRGKWVRTNEVVARRCLQCTPPLLRVLLRDKTRMIKCIVGRMDVQLI